MKSLVYNLDEKIFSNENLVNELGYSTKEKAKERYNKLIKDIYFNSKICNDTELLNYLLTIDNANQLDLSIQIFSNSFIRQDEELFDTIRCANLNNIFLRDIISCLKKISNSNINATRKKLLILNSWLIKEENFISFIVENNKDIDDEIMEILLNQAKKDWNVAFKLCCQQILKSNIIKDKKKMLEQVFSAYNSYHKTSEDVIYAFQYAVEIEEIVNSPKEMKKILHLIKQSIYNPKLLSKYISIFNYPEISNNLKLRDYLFNILNQSIELNGGITKFKIVFDVCKNENVRNNENYLNVLKNTKSVEKCYLLSNVFQCEEITNNKELMDLILSMPNYFCLEQLLLAYETEAINKDINILKQIAGLVPFADKMEDARLCYGTNKNEMTWMARYDKYTEGKERQRVLRYFKKD